MNGWSKSGICGPGPYKVEELPGWQGAFIIVDAKGTNCWTRGTGQVATGDRGEAQAVADKWNGSLAGN